LCILTLGIENIPETGGHGKAISAIFFFDDETRKSSGLCIGWVIYPNGKFGTQPGSQDIVGHPELTLLLLQPMCAFREEAMVGDFDGMNIEDSLQTPWVYEKIRVAWPKKEKYE
jgi:hypothetical protein